MSQSNSKSNFFIFWQWCQLVFFVLQLRCKQVSLLLPFVYVGVFLTHLANVFAWQDYGQMQSTMSIKHNLMSCIFACCTWKRGLHGIFRTMSTIMRNIYLFWNQAYDWWAKCHGAPLQLLRASNMIKGFDRCFGFNWTMKWWIDGHCMKQNCICHMFVVHLAIEKKVCSLICTWEQKIGAYFVKIPWCNSFPKNIQ